jgi:Protein of unknown function (DUF1570)
MQISKTKKLVTAVAFVISIVALVTLANPACLAQSSAPLLKVTTTAGEDIFGLPIHWSKANAVMLDPSGRMHHLEQRDISSHKLLEQPFRPQNMMEASRLLQNELGNGFEIQVNGSYIVAAPTGKATRWRDRFQSLSAGYIRYFETRGWNVRQPDFPMIVIVQPNRTMFTSFVAKEAAQPKANVVGSYFPKSNRCVLYQLDGASGIDWSETEATIVHEAIHQLAFNTGAHDRLFSNPLWLVEGLATMFEQPAVYDLKANRSTVESRMLPSRLQPLQSMLSDATSLEHRLRSLIESDKPFQQDAQSAYTVAWALTFYLCERMPSEFGQYLQLLQRRGMGEYPAGARVSDFKSAFQSDPGLLVVQMQRLFQKSSR